MPEPPRPSIESLAPASLARLLDIQKVAAIAWSGEDAAAILRHQLAAPLLPDLLIVPGAEVSRLQSLIRQQPDSGSFLEQLLSPHPSIELLQAIKLFARHASGDCENPLHGVPADILYLAAIAAGLVRCRARITRQTDVDLNAGFAWALAQPAAAPLAGLFREAGGGATEMNHG